MYALCRYTLLGLDSFEDEPVFPDFRVLSRAGDGDLVIGERALRRVVEWQPAVRLHFRIVFAVVKHEEKDPIAANRAIDDLVGWLSGPTLYLSREGVP